jgi:hypothetical protein
MATWQMGSERLPEGAPQKWGFFWEEDTGGTRSRTFLTPEQAEDFLLENGIVPDREEAEEWVAEEGDPRDWDLEGDG